MSTCRRYCCSFSNLISLSRFIFFEKIFSTLQLTALISESDLEVVVKKKSNLSRWPKDKVKKPKELNNHNKSPH